MSWKSGSILADKIWDILESRDIIERIDDDIRAEIALEIVEAFESEDCSTMYECDFVQEFLEYNETSGEWRTK